MASIDAADPSSSRGANRRDPGLRDRSSRRPALAAGVHTVTPADLAEARDAMCDGDDVGAGLLLCGGGSKLTWGHRPRDVERVVATTALDRLVEHDAGDMTATVGAGMPLARLEPLLAGAGQWLAIDPPHETATVGGVFATNDSGPRRLRYGSLRELVIGMTVVLADGTVARSGSKVIKNVAGYDLCKLFCGSLGTLGLVAELTVRLHPLPAQSRTVRVAADARAATELGLALMASPLEPAAVTHGGDALFIRFEGSAAASDVQSRRAGELARGLGFDAVTVAEPDEEARIWRERREAEAGSSGHDHDGDETVLRVATRPSDWAAIARSVSTAADELGLSITLSSQVCLGLHTARIAGGDAPGHARLVERARNHARDLGGYAVVRETIADLDRHVDPFGPPPGSFAVMRRIKQRLDPKRRCARGRFVGGL